MNPFAWLFGLLKKAFAAAKANGLTDEHIQQALALVKEAATKALTNDEKREWVVKLLVSRGVPEALARFAVESAVQMFKAKL